MVRAICKASRKTRVLTIQNLPRVAPIPSNCVQSNCIPAAKSHVFGGVALCWIVCSLVFVTPLAAQRPRQDLKPADVEASIQRGISYLRNSQLKDGEWSKYEGYDQGVTGLCTLALLSCGVPPDDPTVSKALRQLRITKPDKTYSISLRMMALCQAGRRADMEIIARDVQTLAETQRDDGGWDYGGAMGGATDQSNSQFAVLALDAAEAYGVRVPAEVWKNSEKYWLDLAIPSGGWGYRSSGVTGSMTCAGIASMVIVRGRLPGQSRIQNDEIVCCEDSDNKADPIEKGIEYLANNFSVTFNPGQRTNWMYYMYALERVGRLTGRRFIGQHDWYREGTTELIRRQQQIGGLGEWLGDGIGEGNRDIATSMALLFLSKGKRQVLVHRAQYGNDNRWNLHPGALRQLTRSVEKIWGRDLTWQTVKLEGASVADLLQAPVVFLSGPEPLNFDDATKKLLRDYIQQGGFIFAEATSGNGCGDPKPFEDSLRSLCQELFNAPLDRLPPEHPVWTAERAIDTKALPPGFWLYGVQACCRTSVVYSPVALTCRWELAQPDRPQTYSPKITSQLDAALAVGQNVLAYATGRQLRDKLDQPLLVREGKAGGNAPRGTVVIPRLDLGAGGEQAPRALPNLLEWMRTSIPARFKTEPQAIGLSEEALQSYALVFAQGRDNFTLRDAQQTALREFLTNGGTLIANSICGNEAFSKAFRRELQRAIPDLTFETLPPEHPVFSQKFHGFDISKVTLNQPITDGTGIQYAKKTITPVIEVAKVGNQVAVIFSPYDLSCALENQRSPQCTGYTTEDAARIGINLVLFALQQ